MTSQFYFFQLSSKGTPTNSNYAKNKGQFSQQNRDVCDILLWSVTEALSPLFHSCIRSLTEARDRSGPTNQEFCQHNKLWVKWLLSMVPFTYDNNSVHF